jgi:hypothetical protein
MKHRFIQSNCLYYTDPSDDGEILNTETCLHIVSINMKGITNWRTSILFLIISSNSYVGNPDSAVGIATGWTAEGSEIESR